MSRSGYTDDCSGWDLIRWRGAVASAIRGQRGQAFLREMLAVLDAMPKKELIRWDLVTQDGCCALGAVVLARNLDAGQLDPYDREGIAGALHVAPAMVAEISYENDEGTWHAETSAQRFTRVREWIVSQLEPMSGGGATGQCIGRRCSE